VGDIEELANAFADLQHSSEIPKGDEAPPGPWTRAQEKEPVDHEWDADAVWQEWHDLYCALATCNDAPSLDELAADGPIFDSIAAELSPYLHDAELEGGPPPNSVRPGGGMSLLRLWRWPSRHRGKRCSRRSVPTKTHASRFRRSHPPQKQWFWRECSLMHRGTKSCHL
jgi:hypothetical protein